MLLGRTRCLRRRVRFDVALLYARWSALHSERVQSFQQQHPNIDLRMYHPNDPVDFTREDIDPAVTYGKGDWLDVAVYGVLRLDFFPVC